LWQALGRAVELRSRRSSLSNGDERPSIGGRAKKSIKSIGKQKVGWAKWNISRDNALEFIPESGVPTVNARFRALSEGKIYAKRCRRTLVVGRPKVRSAINKGKRTKQLRTKCSYRDIEEKSASSSLALQESKLQCNTLEMTLSRKVNINVSTISGGASVRRRSKKKARSQSYDDKTLSRIISNTGRPSRRGRTLSESKSGCDSEHEQLLGDLSRDEPTFIRILNSVQTPRPAARRAHFGSEEPTVSTFQNLPQTPRPAERRGSGIVSLVTSAIV